VSTIVVLSARDRTDCASVLRQFRLCRRTAPLDADRRAARALPAPICELAQVLGRGWGLVTRSEPPMNCYNCGLRLPLRADDCPACGAPRPIISTSALDGVPRREAEAFRRVVLTMRRVNSRGGEAQGPRLQPRETTRMSRTASRRAWSATARRLETGRRTSPDEGRRPRTNGDTLARRARDAVRRVASQSSSVSRRIDGARRRAGRRLRSAAHRTKGAANRD
jgi:hypothetical protein